MKKKPIYTQVIKSFGMTNMLIEADLDRIEREYDINLGRKHNPEKEIEDSYYPQFDQELRNEASNMANHYQLFYCLEKTIRLLISDVFTSAENDENWWDKDLVPENIKNEVKKRIKKENEAAVTSRSSNPIDYTTFGELGEIIKSNWSLFGGVFNNVKAVEKVMSNLNSLRNPIAHCSPLAEDEVLRLELSLRDWFRIME
jgi:hypothetical protein